MERGFAGAKNGSGIRAGGERMAGVSLISVHLHRMRLPGMRTCDLVLGHPEGTEVQVGETLTVAISPLLRPTVSSSLLP